MTDSDEQLQRDLQPDTPIEQLQHDRLGRFAKGNTVSLVHGGRSERVLNAELPEQREVRLVLAEEVAQIERELGDELSTIRKLLLPRYVQLAALASFLEDKLRRHGPMTAKGSSRALLSAYLNVISTMQSLAGRIGLERKPKTLASLSLEQYAQLVTPERRTPDGQHAQSESE